MTDLYMHLQFAVCVKAFTASREITFNRGLRVNLHVSPQVQRTVEEIPTDFAGGVFDAMSFHMHFHVLHVEEAL